MHDTDPKIHHAVDRFLFRIREAFDVHGAMMYGSRARGDYDQESDVDILIILGTDSVDTLSMALQMSDIAFDVLLEDGVNISPLPVSFREWVEPNTHSNPELLHNISREGIRL